MGGRWYGAGFGLKMLARLARIRSRREQGGSVAVKRRLTEGAHPVNNLIYIVGLVVVVIAVLSFFGLR